MSEHTSYIPLRTSSPCPERVYVEFDTWLGEPSVNFWYCAVSPTELDVDTPATLIVMDDLETEHLKELLGVHALQAEVTRLQAQLAETQRKLDLATYSLSVAIS